MLAYMYMFNYKPYPNLVINHQNNKAKLPVYIKDTNKSTKKPDLLAKTLKYEKQKIAQHNHMHRLFKQINTSKPSSSCSQCGKK